MTRFSQALTLATAWLTMLAAVGCAPPVSRAAHTPPKKKSPAAAAIAKEATSDKTPPQDAGKQDSDKDAWGTLSGKFKFVGDAPKMREFKATKDVAVCGAKEPLVAEWVIVGSSGEFANVVIYAMPSAEKWDEAISPIHPAYGEGGRTEARMQTVNCRFVPHILGGTTEQTFVFDMGDSTVGHNPDVKPLRNRGFDTIPSSSTTTIRFKKPERIPFEVSCTIHPWMRAHILARPDPYFAISAKDGTFKIENLPARQFAFQIWHEALGHVKTITVDGQKLVANKGVHTWTVKPGDNDLGEVEIAATDYAKQLEKYK